MARNPFIAVRVPPEIIKSLDDVAAQSGITRPDLIKQLLANCHSFYKFIEAEKARQQTDHITLNGNLSKWILNNMPEEMTPDWVHFLGEVMHHVAEQMVAKGKPDQQKSE
jgi:hypothetical protein